MNYEVGENEIVTRLNAHFVAIGKADKFIAALMPETEAEATEYEQNFPKTCVAVQYLDSDYQRPSSLGIVKQDEVVTFRLLFEGRKKRGVDGVTKMIVETKLSLIGFRLSDADQLFVSGNGNQQFSEGVWVPYLDFQCKTVNVQAFTEPDAIGGLLNGIDFGPTEFGPEFQNSFQ